MSAPSSHARIHYEFSTICLPDHKVTLFVTAEGLSRHALTTRTAAVWQDVVQCFTHGGFPAVADLLQTLPYEAMGSDLLAIRGPNNAQRQRVFHALAASCYEKDDADGPSPDPIPEAVFPYAMPPEAVLSVSVEFFRMPRPPHLLVQVHHGAVRSWSADDMPPPDLDPCLQQPLEPAA